MAQSEALLGGTFDSWVKKQLESRSKLISDPSYRSADNLSYLHYTGKNSFIRLSSGVDISDEVAKRLGMQGSSNAILAKSYILQGGLFGRNGFSDTYKFNPRDAGHLGHRPMPGIDSVQITTRGRWGSLREANIRIKAFDREQLSRLEVLFMHPGYTLLLEWGHNTYINTDANNNIVVRTDISPIDGFFDGGKDRKKIYAEILAKQEAYAGNYDAFIGPVTNFTSIFNNDGSYDITIKAISWGAVVESLKINASGQLNTKALEEALKIKTAEEEEETTSDKPQDEEIIEEYKPSRLAIVLSKLSKLKEGLKQEKFKVINPPNIDEYFDLTPFENLTEEQRIKEKNEIIKFIVIPFVSSDEEKTGPSIYMPLKGLLSLISKLCVISDEGGNMININFNTKDNLCYSPRYHISMDPRVCLIKYQEPDFALYEKNETLINNKEYQIINDILPDFRTTSLNSDTETPMNTGFTMNIMINVDYILNTLENMEKNQDKSEVNLHAYLEQIMRDVATSLGDINEFNVAIPNGNDVLKITDVQNLTSKSPSSITLIPTLGLKSIVSNVSITTEISNRLGSMVAIGAQGSGGSIGKDASFMTKYNEGLTDRTNKIVTKPEDATKVVKIIDNPFITSGYKVINKALLKLTSLSLVPALIDGATGAYRDFLNSYKSITSPGLNVIPFKFNIKMDGISGIKYGQVFSVEPERLPKNWLNPQTGAPELAFLVTDINHDINNTWTTSIGGQASPYRAANKIVTVEDLLSGKATAVTPMDKNNLKYNSILYAYMELILKLQKLLDGGSVDGISFENGGGSNILIRKPRDLNRGPRPEEATTDEIMSRIDLILGRTNIARVKEKTTNAYMWAEDYKGTFPLPSPSPLQNQYLLVKSDTKVLGPIFERELKNIYEQMDRSTVFHRPAYVWNHTLPYDKFSREATTLKNQPEYVNGYKSANNIDGVDHVTDKDIVFKTIELEIDFFIS